MTWRYTNTGNWFTAVLAILVALVIRILLLQTTQRGTRKKLLSYFLDSWSGYIQSTIHRHTDRALSRIHLQLAHFLVLKERRINVPPNRRLTAGRRAHRRRGGHRRRLLHLLVLRHIFRCLIAVVCGHLWHVIQRGQTQLCNRVN